MPLRTSEDERSKIDENYSKGSGSYLSEAERTAMDGIENNYDQDADPSQENDNIQRTRNKESSPGWKTNIDTVKGAESKIKGTFRMTKKKGAMAAIIAILGGGGGLLFLGGPGLAVLQIQEVLGDLDDASSIFSSRQDNIMRQRLKTSSLGTVGLCAGKVTIKCKFSTMSKYQLNKFTKAGITIECSNGPCDSLLRNKPTKITFPDGSVLDDPNSFRQFTRDNPTATRSIISAQNPTYYAWASTAASKAAQITGWDKTKKIAGNNIDKIKENFNKALNGRERASVAIADAPSSDEDKEKNPNIEGETSDAKGKLAEVQAKINESKGFSAGLKGVGIAGAVDSACTIIQTSRAFSVMSKVIRNKKLIAFGAAIVTVASSIRAGEATPEEVQFVGDLFTKTDTRETLGAGADGVEVKNPGYKQGAFDSPLYKLSAFGDVPNPSNMSPTISEFTAGGFGAGVLATVYSSAVAAAGGKENYKNTCAVVQNPVVRGGSILFGVVSSLTPLGLVRTAASVAASAVAVNMAMGYMEQAIVAEAEDVDVDTFTEYGNDAFAATWTGYSGMAGGVAQATGGAPVTAENLQAFIDTKEETKQKNIAHETEIAKATPFDITNQYSFLGNVSRSAASSVRQGNILSSTLGILKTSVASLSPSAQAVSSKDKPERYSQCQDDEYESLGIKADVMCNIRYSMTSEQLSMDADVVADYMIENHVNDDAPEEAGLEAVAKSEKYKKFLTHCTYRTTPYGSQGEEGEDTWTTGEACLGKGDLSKEELDNFRVFTADYTVIQAMDYESPVIGGVAASTPGSGNAGISGDSKQLAQMILDSGNVTGWDGDNGAGGLGILEQLKVNADGTATPDCVLSPKLLKVLAGLSKNHTMRLSDLSRNCANSNLSHSAGGHWDRPATAVDFDMVDGDNNPENNVALINELLTYVDSGENVIIGQIQCRGGGKLTAPSGVTFVEFNDGCGHLHIGIKTW